MWEKCIQDVLWEDLRTRDHLEDLGVDGRIDLAPDRDRWGTLVKVVMNIRVPYNAGNFFTTCGPFSFSGRTLLMELV